MRLIYLSHPEVAIDPEVPVPDWGLSPTGRQRLAAALARGWPQGTFRLVSSPEVKARETAAMIAAARGWGIEIARGSGEVDRAATGYVPHARHEELADLLFGQPAASAAGWERATDAQARILSSFQSLGAQGDVMMVGHGAVGSFLYCALSGTPITRAEDQRRGGSVWEIDLSAPRARVIHPWRVLEDV